jgi:glycosyltransferase involved in cell wall biosynthesis
MHILFLSDNFPPESNALTARLYEHAQFWLKQGHEVTVVTCAPNFPEGSLFPGYRNHWRQVEVMGGIRVVRVKTYMTANEGFFKRTLDFVSFMVMGAFFALFERKPDVVVATSPQFFCAVGGWVVAALRCKPLVLEIRDLWPDSIVAVGAMRRNAIIRFFEWLERFLYNRSKVIVAVTDGIRREIVKKGIAEERVVRVINGVDMSRYMPASSDPALLDEYDLSGKFVIGYIGTHGMAHALDKVLDAAELLRDRTDVAFLFAGGGANRSNLELAVVKRGLPNVRMVPRQAKEQMPRLWAMCDMALVSLRNTPLFASAIPSKMFEAMGMGVPLLLSVPFGEATAIVDEAGAGVCVKPENPEALASKIRELVDSPEDVERFAKASYKAATYYSREVQAQKMETVFQRAVSVPSK